LDRSGHRAAPEEGLHRPFGIGDSSNLTWSLLAVGQWRFARAWSRVFGYRFMDIDQEDPDDGFAMDVSQQPPVVAVAYSWQ
jgi:hypothetical protein